LTKLAEAQEAIENGCEELDVVLNIGKMKSGNYEYVKKEL
jgi:deoxyribose-phosphate aldolase